MAEIWLCGYQSFDDYIFDLIHEIHDITALAFENLENCTQRSFVTNIPFFILAILIIFRKLVYCVISQMHVTVVHIV